MDEAKGVEKMVLRAEDSHRKDRRYDHTTPSPHDFIAKLCFARQTFAQTLGLCKPP